MSQGMDLELLRQIFGDPRMHIGFGVIRQLGLAVDHSSLRVQVALLPEEREIIAQMSWADSGALCGDITFPEVDDAVLVAFVEGDPDHAYVIARFSSKDEPLPAFATSGHSVKYARPGKKLYLGSASKVCIARPAVEPTEPLVLGAVFQTFMSTVLQKLIDTQAQIMALVDAFNAHTHVGNLGYLTTTPQPTDITAATLVKTSVNTAKSAVNSQKSSPIDDGAVLSQIAFTEKGA